MSKIPERLSASCYANTKGKSVEAALYSLMDHTEGELEHQEFSLVALSIM